MHQMGLSTQVRHRTRRIPQGSFLGSSFISPSIVSSSFLTSTKDLKNYSQPWFSLEPFPSRDHLDLLASNTDPKPRPWSFPHEFSPTWSFSSICSFMFVFSQSYIQRAFKPLLAVFPFESSSSAVAVAGQASFIFHSITPWMAILDLRHLLTFIQEPELLINAPRASWVTPNACQMSSLPSYFGSSESLTNLLFLPIVKHFSVFLS